ncbi:MAG: hypothetical protein KF915_16710 [Polyangiaceae bacterium]|nr:hypothetical protein [Polyangiaceae bacterium]
MSLRTLSARCGVLLAGLTLFSCETFDPPPKVELHGAVGGFMTEAPGSDIVISFNEDFERSSLRLRIVRADKALDIDPEGKLADEPDYCGPQRARGQCDGAVPAPCCTNEGLAQSVYYDGASDRAEGGRVSVDGRRIIIKPDEAPRIAVPYMLIIEPGLRDLEGNESRVRQKVEFAYRAFLPGPSSLPTGPYFFLFDIAPPPIQQQLRLYAWLDVNQTTGEWVGLFTDANRTTALNSRPGCPSNCGLDVCQLYPSPNCVRPSTNMGSIDEFRDMIPIKDRPLGYTFLGSGYTADLPDGTTGIGTPEFPIDITIGAAGGVRITAVDTVIIGQLAQDSTGRWRGSGSASIRKVQINGRGEDPTTGTLSFMSLTEEEQREVESFGEPIYKPGEVDPLGQ